MTACKDDDGFTYGDSSEFDVSVYHTNPVTGVDYTEEELSELLYNPEKEESYSEGQTVDLALITSKQPSLIRIISGDDFSEIGSISQFSGSDGKIKSESYISSLENLGLTEIGDKLNLKFEISYQDGTSGVDFFSVKRIKFKDPNAGFDYYVFLKKSTGEIVGLNTDGEENFTSKTEDLLIGTICRI